MPKNKLNEIKSSASTARAKLLGKTRLSREQIAENVVKMLAAFEAQRGTLAQRGTAEALQKSWEKNLEFYNRYALDYVKNADPAELEKAIRKNDGGRQVMIGFATHFLRMDRLPPDTPPLLMDTGRFRNQSLKERMANGEFATPERKRLVLAEIYAVRDALGAEPGNNLLFTDEKLTYRCPSNLSERAKKFQQNLEQVPDDEISRLYNKMAGERPGALGGSVQEELEFLCKTPVQAEVDRIKKEIENNGDQEFTYDRTARMVWLREHKDFTKEQLREAKESGRQEAEIRAIKNRPDFQRFLNENRNEELCKIIDNVDPYEEDGFRPLDEAYGLSRGRQERFDAVYDPIWNDIKDDPVRSQKLLDTMGEILSDETLEKSDTIKGRFIKSLDELNEAIGGDPGNSQGVKEALEKVRIFHAALRRDEKDYEAMCQAHPGLKEMETLLRVPEKGTAESYGLYLKANALSSGAAEGIGNDRILYFKAALREKIKGAEDPKTVRVDDAEIYSRGDQLYAEQYTEGAGTAFERYSSQQVFAMLMDYDQGESAEKNILEFREEQNRERAKNQTVAEHIEELLDRPFHNKQYADVRETEEREVDILAARALWREVQEHPERFRTKEDADRCFKDMRRAINVARADAKKGSAKNVEAVKKTFEENVANVTEDDGKAVEDEFKKSIIGITNIKSWKDLDPALMPTARQQIEALQDQLRKNEIKDEHGRRCALAQILAAREVLGVRRGVRGGDPKLDKPMTKACFDKAEKIREELRGLPKEELDRLCEAATAGHGGRLQEEVDKIRSNQAAEADKLSEDLPAKYRPTAKKRIEAIQKKLENTEDPAQKRRYVAEIIAARLAVDARRGSKFGGDSRLDDNLDPRKVNVRAEEIDGYLAMMPQETLDTLAQQALNGHGGEMTETYKGENTYQKQLDRAKTNAGQENAPQLSPGKLLAITVMAKQTPNQPINEKNVRDNVRQLESQPGYQEQINSAEAKKLIREGDFETLVVNVRKSLQNAQMPQEVKKNGPEPEGPAQEVAPGLDI